MAVNLRQEAKGRECQIRIPGVCNKNPETVVLCHIHKPSVSGGMGVKADDILGAHGCSDCHDAVDFRDQWRHQTTRDAITMQFYEGVFRTQKILLDEDKITY